MTAEEKARKYVLEFHGEHAPPELVVEDVRELLSVIDRLRDRITAAIRVMDEERYGPKNDVRVALGGGRFKKGDERG